MSYMTFVDLTKAFDTASLVAVVDSRKSWPSLADHPDSERQLHDGLQVRVLMIMMEGSLNQVTNGVNQGCVMAQHCSA